MRLFELAYGCRLFAHVVGDAASLAFRASVGSDPDPALPDHGLAVARRLNAWGCRGLAIQHHQLAAASLATWWGQWGPELPPPGVGLWELTEAQRDSAAGAYAALRDTQASWRKGARRAVAVRFGPTAAAKTLFLLRPHALVPWDEGIRAAFKLDGSEDSYRAFLVQVRAELATAATEAGVAESALPVMLGRPESTPSKLVDEYYWVTVSQGWAPPTARELAHWCSWAALSQPDV
jgi:hypothetical protein